MRGGWAAYQIVVENVRGAQPWVGRARRNFGSFYLWGDVLALMPITLGRQPDMFPWTPQGPIEPSNRFRDFEPVNVLDWFDGPRLFTIREEDIQYLVYLCLEAPHSIRYLVSPTDEDRLKALVTGVTTVFNALKNPVLWAVDTDENGNTKTVHRISWGSVPLDIIPKPHVLLSRALEAAFNVHVEGKTLSSTSITASLLNKYVSNSYSLLDRFFEIINWERGVDPLVQQIALGSITLSYGAPGGLSNESDVAKLRAEFEHKIGEDGDPKMVQAIMNMCPFIGAGQVDSVTFGGQLVPSSTLILKRGDRKVWKNTLANVLQLHKSVTLDVTGVVEEIDGGKRTFTLRGIDGPTEPEMRCRADEAIISELREEFAEGFPRIRITGTRTIGESVVRVDQYELIAANPPPLPTPQEVGI